MTGSQSTDAMAWSWRREAPALVVLAVMWIASVVSWPLVDEPIPMHWNASGEVDRAGGKAEGLLLLPAITSGLFLLLTFLPRVDPARANYGLFAGTYRLIRVSFVAFMGLVHAIVLATAFGADVDMFYVMPIGLGALFLVLGNAMGKVRPNFFAGIRTPWTLASVKSWNATHRVGGWVFMAAGVAFLGMIFVREPGYLTAALVGVAIAGAGLMAYSWWIWHGDDERISVTMSQPAEE